MSNRRSLDVLYDAESDVLYVSRRREPAARGVEDKNGIVWRYGDDGELVGATVPDFNGHWLHREPLLAKELSRRFRIPAATAKAAVEQALESA